MAGKNEALFKPFLFADQELDALVADMAPRAGALAEAIGHLRAGRSREAEVVLGSAILTDPGEVSAWHRLTLAAAQAKSGKNPAALRTLRNLLDGARESRIRLWSWHAVRGLGGEPPPEPTVEGVVVEVGNQTLATYADGTARAIAASGARFIWDRLDDRLKPLTDAVLAAAGAALDSAQPGRREAPTDDKALMTVLLPSGPRWLEDVPSAPAFAPAAALRAAIASLAGW